MSKPKIEFRQSQDTVRLFLAISGSLVFIGTPEVNAEEDKAEYEFYKRVRAYIERAESYQNSYVITSELFEHIRGITAIANHMTFISGGKTKGKFCQLYRLSKLNKFHDEQKSYETFNTLLSCSSCEEVDRYIYPVLSAMERVCGRCKTYKPSSEFIDLDKTIKYSEKNGLATNSRRTYFCKSCRAEKNETVNKKHQLEFGSIDEIPDEYQHLLAGWQATTADFSANVKLKKSAFGKKVIGTYEYLKACRDAWQGRGQDFDKVIDSQHIKYLHSHEKVAAVCRKHGKVYLIAAQLLKAGGCCSQCLAETRADYRVMVAAVKAIEAGVPKEVRVADRSFAGLRKFLVTQGVKYDFESDWKG